MGPIPTLCVVKAPAEAYDSIVQKGVELCNKPSVALLHQSIYAGCYIGFGGLLSLTIAGNLRGWDYDEAGMVTWIFAALFPVNLLLIILSGGLLFTGATFTTPAALIEGQVKWYQVVKVLSVSWLGNLTGGIIFACFTELCQLNVDTTAARAIKLTVKKTSMDFGTVFCRGIGCNWLVCLAVYLSTMAQDMTGKYVGIFFPISCFVASGFEHYPANAYTLPLGWSAIQKLNQVNGTNYPTSTDIFVKNIIPSSLGNFFAGAIFMAAGYSFAYGRLGCVLQLCSKVALKNDNTDEADGTNIDSNIGLEVPHGGVMHAVAAVEKPTVDSHAVGKVVDPFSADRVRFSRQYSPWMAEDIPGV